MTVKPWSVVAFLLSLFIGVVVIVTAFIDSATFLSRLHTTIIAWQLPLVAIGVTIYSFIKESDEESSNPLAWMAVLLLSASLFCSNLTKNAVQDIGSNVENYVDVAASIIKDEKENVKDYAKTLKKAAENRNDSDEEDYYYDNYGNRHRR